MRETRRGYIIYTVDFYQIECVIYIIQHFVSIYTKSVCYRKESKDSGVSIQDSQSGFIYLLALCFWMKHLTSLILPPPLQNEHKNIYTMWDILIKYKTQCIFKLNVDNAQNTLKKSSNDFIGKMLKILDMSFSVISAVKMSTFNTNGYYSICQLCWSGFKNTHTKDFLWLFEILHH